MSAGGPDAFSRVLPGFDDASADARRKEFDRRRIEALRREAAARRIAPASPPPEPDLHGKRKGAGRNFAEAGIAEARRKGLVKGPVEVWFSDKTCEHY